MAEFLCGRIYITYSTQKKQIVGLHDHEDQQLQKPRNWEEDTAECEDSIEGDITYSPNPIFSDEEEARFARRYENGYDLKHDKRYNLWLAQHHPDHAPEEPLACELSFASPDASFADKTGEGSDV